MCAIRRQNKRNSGLSRTGRPAAGAKIGVAAKPPGPAARAAPPEARKFCDYELKIDRNLAKINISRVPLSRRVCAPRACGALRAPTAPCGASGAFGASGASGASGA